MALTCENLVRPSYCDPPACSLTPISEGIVRAYSCTDHDAT